MKKHIKSLIEEYNSFLDILDSTEDDQSFQDIIYNNMYHPVNRRELMDIVDSMVNNGYTDFNNIDVSRITDFDDIFSKDTSYWLNDTGHYETRKRNPGSLQALPKIDVSSWNTSSGKTFRNMFKGYKGEIIGVEHFDVSSAEVLCGMFEDCINFNTDISHWDISNCHITASMFANCINFNHPFEVIKLKENQDKQSNFKWSCGYMYSGCASLTKAPKLPATDLQYSCYNSMFANCISLTEAPELPATTLADSCYADMFNGCTSLLKAPELPATELKYYCYKRMFEGCTSLTEMPELPATVLGEGCYYNMFKGCKNLTIVHDLNALILKTKCYWGMFQNCTSLKESPKMAAIRPYFNSHNNMFSGCTNLQIVHCSFYLPLNHKHEDYIKNWLKNVAKEGTIYIKRSNGTISSSDQGLSLPSYWSKAYEPEE